MPRGWRYTFYTLCRYHGAAMSCPEAHAREAFRRAEFIDDAVAARRWWHGHSASDDFADTVLVIQVFGRAPRRASADPAQIAALLDAERAREKLAYASTSTQTR